MPELSKQEQAHLLEAVIRQAEIRDAKLAVLRDPTKLAAMCEMATCAEDATEGIWFRFDEGSPHADWNRFLDEDNDRGKVLLAARGTAKSTFGRMKMAAKYAEDHDFTLFYGGETAVNVGKRSVRMRTMLTRKAFTEGYGIAPTMQDWGSKTFTVQRPMGPGDPPSLEVTSPDKPGTGSHYRHRMLDDPNGEKSFMSQKYAEQAERWYQSMQAQSMGKTKEWILNTPWPGKTIVRTIRDEVEGGFTWEKYGRCWIHRGEEYDVLKVGVYDEMGKPLWDFLPEKVLKRIRRKLHSQLLWLTQFDCEFIDLSELAFKAAWVLFQDPPVDGNDELKLPLSRWMSIDTATSTQGGKTSESSLSVVDLDPYDAGYLREMEIGQIPPKDLAKRSVRMWKRWKPKKLMMESNASAAQMLEPQIQEIAKRNGIGHIPVKWIPRAVEKGYRILGFRDVVAEGRFRVCSTVDEKVIAKGPKGAQLIGKLGKQFTNWVYGTGESFDGLDNLTDFWLCDKYGKRYCKPPLLPEPEKEPEEATHESIMAFFKSVRGGGGWVG